MSPDLATRLQHLGDLLVVDDGGVAERVVQRIEARPTKQRATNRRWLAAAAVVVFALGGVALYPETRQAIARWFGLDRVEVRIDPDLTVPPSSIGLPGPGEPAIVEVDGRQIQVAALRGELDTMILTKTVGSPDQIHEVRVRGRDGLWITGGPHTVLYRTGDGIEEQRVSANTLLWNEGEILYRIEGFTELDEALAFADRL